jgi:hypothetical protein
VSVTFGGYDARRPHPKFAGAFESVELPEERWPAGGLNLANGNARLLLKLLDLHWEARPDWDGLDGSCSLPEARRAVVGARARFDRKAPALARPARVEYGKPRTNEDGTVELRPVRLFEMGADEDYLAGRLDAFEKLLGDLERAGATHVSWG